MANDMTPEQARAAMLRLSQLLNETRQVLASIGDAATTVATQIADTLEWVELLAEPAVAPDEETTTPLDAVGDEWGEELIDDDV